MGIIQDEAGIDIQDEAGIDIQDEGGSSTTTTISTTSSSSTASTTSSTSPGETTTSSTTTSSSTTSSISSTSSTSTLSTTTTSLSSTSSTTTTVFVPKEGYAFGEQNPTDENSESWSTWVGGEIEGTTIIGDPDWGKLKVWSTASGQSAVKDLGSIKTRVIVLKRDKYGSGSGNITMYIRGQATVFLQNDVSPSWEEYTAPVKKDWRYIQTKVEYSI